MSKKINRPTFFIVGAPRSGTTSLYEYLKAHPEIYMAPYKEPHFFATDLKPSNPWLKKLRIKKHYLALFSQAKGEKQIGEASVLYLYSKAAAENIKKFNPGAKIIIMLRSPIEVMTSLYHQLYHGGDEKMASFEEALRAETDRKKGKKLPHSKHAMKEFYFYREIAKFSRQVRRFYDLFKKDQIMVIIFEDFKENTPLVYQKVLKFLGVDPGFVPDFRVVNPNRRLRSRKLRSAFERVALWLNKLKPELFLKLRPAYKLLEEKFFLRPAVRRPIAPELKKRLKKEFLPEVRKLSKIINHDVTYWCE